jgi:cytochrome c-type biogenesis protein CcmH
MSIFVILAVLMTAGALMFVLPALLAKSAPASAPVVSDDPSLRVLRDQLRELDVDLANGSIAAVEYDVARQELQRRVSEDVHSAMPSGGSAVAGHTLERRTAALLSVGVAVLATVLYLLLGTPAGLDPAQVASGQDQTHAVGDQQIESMVTALAERLQTDPSNIEGWSMLARSYKSLGRFKAASEAYAHLVQLVPDDADLLASYADTLATVQENNLQGEPERLINRALALEPLNIKALALSGSAAFERKDYARAIVQWQKILPLLPAGSEMGRSLESSIDEARQAAGGSGAVNAVPVAQALEPAKDATKEAAKDATKDNSAGVAKGLSGTVTLDPALLSQVAPTDTVFIFARPAEGSRRPLAVLRKQVKDLPVSFTLDDSMSMSADSKLSDATKVVVGARISKTANATAVAGDLEGLSDAISSTAKGLKIQINSFHQ